MFVVTSLVNALSLAASMFWDVFWALALGFLLSAVVETVVSKRSVARVLGRDTPQQVAIAAGLGAASSSCSYAAVAVARSLFRKGATLGNSIIFEFASTNLVFELGLVLLVLLGWQFVAAELSGGVVMVIVLAIVFRLTLKKSMVDDARIHAERGILGKMEGHGAMDMSITDGPFVKRLFSRRAFTAISHVFFMNIYSLWSDLLIGFVIAGALGAWVPETVWSQLFFNNNGLFSEVWGALLGPVIAMLSFVCSIGNVPLAAVLWRGGISFSGVIAFIFADLIILPILNIYRKYYGKKVAVYLFVVSYLTMVVAGLIVGVLFHLVGFAPTTHSIAALTAQPSWNYTTIFNVVFLVLAMILGMRFLQTGGTAMLAEMDKPPSPSVVRDPVCGMTVDPTTSRLTTEYEGVTYWFCSAGCCAAFEKDPRRYQVATSVSQ